MRKKIALICFLFLLMNFGTDCYAQTAMPVKKQYYWEIKLNEGLRSNDSVLYAVTEFDKSGRRLSYANFDAAGAIELKSEYQYTDTLLTTYTHFEKVNSALTLTSTSAYLYDTNKKKIEEKTYDPAGKDTVVRRFFYDPSGNMIKESRRSKDALNNVDYIYTYDKNGRQLSITIDPAQTGNTEYPYNRLVILSGTSAWTRHGKLKKATSLYMAGNQKSYTSTTWKYRCSSHKIKSSVTYRDSQLESKQKYTYGKPAGNFTRTSFYYKKGALAEKTVEVYRDEKIRELKRFDHNNKLIGYNVYSYEYHQ